MCNNFQAVACRAVWKVSSEDVELARLQIASKHLRLHKVLSSTQGVQFYFLCVMSNAKSTQMSDEESTEAQSYPTHRLFYCVQGMQDTQQGDPVLCPSQGRYGTGHYTDPSSIQ
jgi:hypothetical protein